MNSFVERWQRAMTKLTRRQAWFGAGVSLFIIAGAFGPIFGGNIYPPGDARGDPWLKVLTVAVLTFFALWVLVPSVLRLRRP
jgi:hypothetical protein